MPSPLPWLDLDDPFPDAASAWDADSPAPGLLAAGGALDVAHLRSAYSQGIFPWFSGNQPILWWTPDPRMVLAPSDSAPRQGQDGTWIVADMVAAYEAFHAAGYAHSVETWVDGRLVGGLYCVGLGQAVFGESMFAHTTDASKIALAALVCLCRRQQVALIDCQQNTRHLASLGAREITRTHFTNHLRIAHLRPALQWTFEPLYWSELLSSTETQA